MGLRRRLSLDVSGGPRKSSGLLFLLFLLPAPKALDVGFLHDSGLSHALLSLEPCCKLALGRLASRFLVALAA